MRGCARNSGQCVGKGALPTHLPPGRAKALLPHARIRPGRLLLNSLAQLRLVHSLPLILRPWLRRCGRRLRLLLLMMMLMMHRVLMLPLLLRAAGQGRMVLMVLGQRRGLALAGLALQPLTQTTTAAARRLRRSTSWCSPTACCPPPASTAPGREAGTGARRGAGGQAGREEVRCWWGALLLEVGGGEGSEG